MKQKSQDQRLSPYKIVQTKFIEFLKKYVFVKYLKSPQQMPLHEIFCYNDADSIKNCVRGSAKAAIHQALTSPHFFFEVSTFTEVSKIFYAFLILKVKPNYEYTIISR